jgi:hypothetical protein
VLVPDLLGQGPAHVSSCVPGTSMSGVLYNLRPMI